jgi:RNA polymerase sigma-70 factor (ECF subfamily)
VPSDADFQTLLAAARQGAEWAWAQLYREYAPPVLRYLKARGAHEPEDLLGEVFLQLVRNLPGFEGDERDFRAWVFMIAHNRLVDEVRASGRNPSEPVPHDVLGELSATGHAEEDAMQRLGEQEVLRTLSRLTADQRDVLFLRFFARLTAEEVARVLGKRVGAVKALQSRALATIRREMSK